MKQSTRAGSVFAGIDRVDARLTIFDWPDRPDLRLEEAVTHLAAFEAGNAEPEILEADGGRHLAWEGSLTGGLATLYERLSPFLVEQGLDAVFADARLEVFAPATGPVVVLGVRRRPAVLPRPDFERRMARLDQGDEVDSSFPPSAVARALERALPAARSCAAAARSGTQARRLTPFRAERLSDAETTVTERYDPAGNLEEAWISCQTLDWRTDFLAPGTCRVPGERLERSLMWRSAQWEWLAERGSDSDLGRWVLRAHNTSTAADVAALLPAGSLTEWVRRTTEEGIRLCGALIEGGRREVEPARDRLCCELRALVA